MTLRLFVSSAVLASCLFAQGQSGRTPSSGKPTDPGNSGSNGKPTDPGNSGGNGKPTDPGNPGGGGKPTDPGNSGNAGNNQPQKDKTIEWLTDEAAVEQALLDKSKGEVQFKSSLELENLDVWLTPSLASLVADPQKFAVIKKDTIYTITLKLDQAPDHTLGGTIHLRSGDEDSRTYAPPFPLTVKIQGGDDGQQQPVVITAVASSADHKKDSVTSGQLVSVSGSGIGPEKPESLKLDVNGRVSTYLGDTQVLFNGIPAPVLAASSGLVDVVVPHGVASDSNVDVILTYKGRVSRPVTLPVEPASPALFTMDGTGQGQSAAFNQNGDLNSSDHPASRGTTVTLFGSGFGEWKQSVPDGAIVDSTLLEPKSTISVTIGGAAAKVLYAGGTLGLVSGVVRIDAEVPAQIIPGDKVTVVVTVGDKSSSASVTVAVE